MRQAALDFLGIAQRAGALITGTPHVLSGIRSGAIKQVVIAHSVSAGTRKKIVDKCHFYNVPYVEVDEEIALGHAIGKENRKVIGIRDDKLAKAFQAKLVGDK